MADVRTGTRTDGEAPHRPVRNPAGALALTSTATAVALMNYTAPMVTLPGMSASFGTSVSGQAWLLNGVPLGLAALLLVAGSFADDYGRRQAFLIGTVGLGVTTGLGTLATGTLAFTLARIAQGMASAAIIASSLGLLAQAFPAGPGRIRAMGVWGASVSGGIAAGPLVAGALNSIDWRAGYGVFAVAALVVAAFSGRVLEESCAPRPGRPDLLGAALLGVALTALLAALTLGRDGWARTPVIVLLAASGVLAVAFAAAERASRAPMLDLGLFRRPLFLVATSGGLFTGLAVIGVFSYLPALLQQTLGMSALATAWLFLIWSGTAFVVALQTKRLASRVSVRHQLALGFLLSAGGMLAMLGAMGAGSWARLVPGLVVSGVGNGLLNAALPRLAVESVPPERAAMGSGANNTARYIGSSAGVALTIAIATTSASSTGPGTGDRVQALAHGTDVAFLTGAGLSLIGAVIAVVLRERSAGTEPGPYPNGNRSGRGLVAGAARIEDEPAREGRCE